MARYRKLIKVMGVGFVGDYVNYKGAMRKIVKSDKRHRFFYVEPVKYSGSISPSEKAVREWQTDYTKERDRKSYTN